MLATLLAMPRAVLPTHAALPVPRIAATRIRKHAGSMPPGDKSSQCILAGLS